MIPDFAPLDFTVETGAQTLHVESFAHLSPLGHLFRAVVEVLVLRVLEGVEVELVEGPSAGLCYQEL